MLKNVLSAVVGILVFITVTALLGVIVSIVVTLLIQIDIVAFLCRWLFTIPVSRGWYISESTALYGTIGIFAYITGYNSAKWVINKMATKPISVYRAVGILLLLLYVPSIFLGIINHEEIWGAIYGSVAGIVFIKNSKP